MSKAYHMCVCSICTCIIGIILAGFNFFIKNLSYHSRSLLIIASCVLIFIGIVYFLNSYKHYLSVKDLLKDHTSIIARWTYQPNSSEGLLYLIHHQKHISLFISIICLIFIELFVYLFVSGEPSLLPKFGYLLAVLIFFFWIIICRFMLNYYENLAKNESIVLFSKDCIYFMDNVYYFTQGVHILEKVEICHDNENILVFEYGLGDMDTSSIESLMIPIPDDRMQMATYLKNYYCSILPLEDDEF